MEKDITMQLAENAGEKLSAFNFKTVPVIKVFNDGGKPSDKFKNGELVYSFKNENDEWENKVYKKPFKGVILKVRMFLKTKYKYAKNGNMIVTNRFDSYDDNTIITAREKRQMSNGEYRYVDVFKGNYKEVNDRFSLKSDTEIEKKLELHHSLLVLVNAKEKKVIEIVFKGMSRNSFFDYINLFTRVDGDFMSAHFTVFDTEIITEFDNGKQCQFPIARFKFTKGEKLTEEELKKILEIQKEVIDAITMNDAEKISPEEAMAKEKQKMEERQSDNEGVDNEAQNNDEQNNEEQNLPTIDLDDDDPDDIADSKEEEEYKIEDVPF